MSRLLTSNEHDTDGEDLFRVGVWGYISKTNTGQTAEGEVQSGHVLVFNRGSRIWKRRYVDTGKPSTISLYMFSQFNQEPFFFPVPWIESLYGFPSWSPSV